MPSRFVHLHVHNEYSLLDGYGSAEAYAKRASELGFDSLALTNHGNVDGCIKFQSACSQYNILPIIGCELYVVPDASEHPKNEHRGHLIALVKNDKGWQTLCRLLSRANLEGYYYRPRVDYKMLKDESWDGLIFSTACAESFINLPGGVELLRDMARVTQVYLEVMPHNADLQRVINQHCLKLHEMYNLPLLATNDCHYVLEEDTQAQEVLLAIQTRAKWDDKDRYRFSIQGLHLRSEEEMKVAFRRQGQLTEKQYRQAMLNTGKVAVLCSEFSIKKQPIRLPHPPNVKTTMSDIITQGIKDLGIKWTKEYQDRLKEEVRVIQSKGFVDYFLIVWELVNWCRHNNILVGPGRGSVGGSLAAYLMGITEVDPIKYNLLFSRFINEERIDYPDIDLDFEDTKRHLVRQHLEELYGEQNVAGVSTFLTMKGKGAIRDVARVFGTPTKEVDEFAKVIPLDIEKDSIMWTTKGTEEGGRFYKRHKELVDLAAKLEGQVRGAGQHAAAAVISSESLASGMRGNLCRRGKDIVTTNWDMNDVDYVGLIKLDLLGLSTLSIINETLRLIGKTADYLNNIEPNDPAIFKELSEGNTVGVFQMNTWPMTALAKDMGIDSFEDIVAAQALVRPGPSHSGMTKEYIRRKHGARWTKKHPIYEEVTKTTYGVLVYQEQVMQVIHKVAGLSYPTADRIRKIISKKRDVNEFKQYYDQFLKGCLKQKTLSKAEADEFWQGLIEWANYGFNRCLTGDTLVERSSFNQYTGKYVALKDLYLEWQSDTAAGAKYRRCGLDIIQMDGDGRCRPGKMIGIFYQGKKRVYEVKTQTGKVIKGTFNHRLYTYNGYKRIDELKVGDRLAVRGCAQQSITEREGQKWHRVINTKGKRGFQTGKDNPSFVDGRSKAYQTAKALVLKRSGGICENCSAKGGRMEFAHVHTLEECGNDFQKYHHKDNILYLCNSCHKSLDYQLGVRKKRYSKGYPIFYDPIVSIKHCGHEEVFDIEMQTPGHNFIANDIVSHNSHSVEYGMLAYRTAWLKMYHSTEFLCAALTCGSDVKKEELVAEAVRLGLQVKTPKVDHSDPTKWVAKGKCLYMPFTEIKGIGDKLAEKIRTPKTPTKPSKRKGFFNIFEAGEESKLVEHLGNTKLEQLLQRAGAYDDNSTDVDPSLFTFDVSMLDGEGTTRKGLVVKRGRSKCKFDKACMRCNLYQEGSEPVPSSAGIYNVAVLGEAPGREEDVEGRGFVGPAGKLLWKSLEERGYTRRHFHVCNVCRCWPSQTKTPGKAHIEQCWPYTFNELKEMECNLILAVGNTTLLAITGQSGGITKKAGTTEWIPALGAYVCWCIHPSAVLRNPDNRETFELGIENFASILATHLKEDK